MEKSRIDVINEKSKAFYAKAIKLIGDLYEGVFAKNEDFGYTRVQLFADYDAYLQAILLKVCANGENFSLERMTIIEEIADYGKLIDGTDLTLFADCVKDMRQKLEEKADERLKEIPVCFKLSGAVDTGRDVGATKALLDLTVKIAFNLKFIDSEDVKDNSDIVSALKNIYVFFNANGINVK